MVVRSTCSAYLRPGKDCTTENKCKYDTSGTNHGVCLPNARLVLQPDTLRDPASARRWVPSWAKAGAASRDTRVRPTRGLWGGLSSALGLGGCSIRRCATRSHSCVFQTCRRPPPGGTSTTPAGRSSSRSRPRERAGPGRSEPDQSVHGCTIGSLSKALTVTEARATLPGRRVPATVEVALGVDGATDAATASPSPRVAPPRMAPVAPRHKLAGGSRPAAVASYSLGPSSLLTWGVWDRGRRSRPIVIALVRQMTRRIGAAHSR